MIKLSSITKILVTSAILLLAFIDHLSAQKVAIIDAGSSGSRLFVYEVTQTGKRQVKLIYPSNPQEKSGSKGRALSTIANHQDSVHVYLKSMTHNFPCDSIDLYIFATAGMRLKSESQANAVYDKLLKQPAVNGYYVKGAMTLSGQYEGLYGWLAANYDHGTINIANTSEQPMKFTGIPKGILEIGGASMQLAFATEQPGKDCLFRPGLSYIYSKSYLGGGVDQVFKNTPKGKRKYKFHLDMENVSERYDENTIFWGLGIPVNNVLKGIEKQNDKKSYRRRINGYIKTLKDYEDSMKNYHPRINSHYVKWVSNKLDLNNRLVQPTTDSSWTIGAAIDIMINKEAPEKFDYEHWN